MNKYININRLEYAVTYQCSSRCIHCFIPEDQPCSPQHIDPDLAVQILRDVGQKYALNSVMTFGGEPLLYPDVVCAIHQEAKRMNIPHRNIITNGCWSKDEQKTRSIARSLADAGVNYVSMSVDAFHQEYVSLERVKISATALLDAGIREIKWNPCWLMAEENENEYNLKTRAILDELSGLPVKLSDGNVMQPQGKALTNLRTYFRPTFEWLKKSCQDIPYMDSLDNIQTICVEPNGDIPLCQAFMLGNAAQEDIIELLENYHPYENPEMKQILDEGLAGVIDTACSLGVELDENGHYSICDACSSIRRHKKWQF